MTELSKKYGNIKNWIRFVDMEKEIFLAVIGPRFEGMGKGVSLDEFFKSALREGLDFQVANGRGYLPAGLVEEIRALSMPVIPWDVELARWFDDQFPPLEKHRTYARPSRRQGGDTGHSETKLCPSQSGSGE